MLTILYVSGIIVSIIFYAWIAFRRVEWSWKSFLGTWLLALAWAVGMAELAWAFDHSSRPTEYFLIQLWLTGVFLIPAHAKLLTWHFKEKRKMKEINEVVSA